MTALFPIEPIIQAAEENERVVEILIRRDDPLSTREALDRANHEINALIHNINKKVLTSEERLAIATHLTAFGIVAIGRTDDILHTLTNTRGVDAEDLVEKLCKMRLSFTASGYDEISWIENLENKFPPEEDADADR